MTGKDILEKIVLTTILAGFAGFAGCSLEGTTEFSCGGGPDPELLTMHPEDTVFVQLESSDLNFNKTFAGIRSSEFSENPVEGEFSNLTTFQQAPDFESDRLFGLGTQITDESDSSGVIIAFNEETGSYISDLCRSTKILVPEHNWSRWSRNLPGAEIILTIPVDGVLVTFSSDTSQEDESFFKLDGVEKLGTSEFFARLQGSFQAEMEEQNSPSGSPMKVTFSGNFVLTMQVSI